MPKRRADARWASLLRRERQPASSERRDPSSEAAGRHPLPRGNQKLVGTAHVHFPNGGGYSYSRRPKCDKLAGALYLIDDAPLQAF
jgi:hypothetical protein